ncbi:MAG: signal peptide peptidase SppA [Chloroflexi bacterium]|nr:signal peptide peptidase SppA [Chloroflexota bacterium]MCY3697465.1 signal peptide peptidase SppA [Chloroflexota bacterium]MXX81128.1 signal peptide peptidase SppA [Chloroflexota bacterium]MYF22107.1 signal peptide peptidase SppA [Chloroflexota bacterium]
MDFEQYLSPPRVAVIEVAGQIGARLNPRELSRTLNSVRTNPRYPAVVLDIDSPGGGAAASEALYLATKRLSDKKPVAASIRGVGASGGYMIACAANPIFALPTSVVGSIGVIWTAPMISEALERVGVKMRTRAAGEYKDMGSLFRDSTPEEEAKLDALIQSVYERFVDIVAEGRPELTREQVAALASGEIHTGAEAHEIGLVDRLGDLNDAVEWAADAAGIEKRTTLVRPKRGLLQMLMTQGADSVAHALVDAFIDRLDAARSERLLEARWRMGR